MRPMMPRRSADDYTVGYARPPTETRFQKGISGNPGGRPRRSKGLFELLWEELGNKISINENGRHKSINKLHGVLKQVVNRALTGNERSAKLILQLLRQLENPETLTSYGDGRVSIQFVQEVMKYTDRAKVGLAEES